MLSAKLIMRLSLHFTALLSALLLVNGQDASFCEENCVDSPTSLTNAGIPISPLETGPLPEIVSRQDECYGFKGGSYIANGDLYLKTFDTVTVSPTVGPYTEDTEVEVTHNQSVSRTTSFDVSRGDPFEIISRSIGVEFEDSRFGWYTTKVSVLAGQQGVIGFTPVFECTTGTLEDCDGVRTDPGESCTPFLTGNGIVQGDYLLIQS